MSGRLHWHPIASAADQAAALRLLQRPMPAGRFQVAYALARFEAPEHCADLQGLLVQTDSWTADAPVGPRDPMPAAVALRWRWPDGTPYLAGLRSNQSAPLGRRLYAACFAHLLGEEGWALTTIGRGNAAARRLLTAQVPGLPTYRPVQGLASWVLPPLKVPLGARRSAVATQPSCRHFALHGGGLLGHAARLAAQLGLWPGPVPNGQPMPLALPTGIHDLNTLRQAHENATGCWVGFTLPENHALDAQLRRHAPRGTQRFESDVFTVAMPGKEAPQKLSAQVEAAWL